MKNLQKIINKNKRIYVAYNCSLEKSGLFKENKIALIIKELNIKALNKLYKILSNSSNSSHLV